MATSCMPRTKTRRLEELLEDGTVMQEELLEDGVVMREKEGVARMKEQEDVINMVEELKEDKFVRKMEEQEMMDERLDMVMELQEEVNMKRRREVQRMMIWICSGNPRHQRRVKDLKYQSYLTLEAGGRIQPLELRQW